MPVGTEKLKSWPHYASSREPLRFTESIERPRHDAATPEVVERMLRLGLQAHDGTAAQAVQHLRLRALLPELRDLLDTTDAGGGPQLEFDPAATFRIAVVLAANAVDPTTDYAPQLVPSLASGDESVRISAAMGARQISKAERDQGTARHASS